MSAPGEPAFPLKQLWAARWSFVDRFNTLLSGSAEADSLEGLRVKIMQAAEESLCGPNKAEGDETDTSFDRLGSALRLHAAPEAMTTGGWRYRADGWVDVTITYHESANRGR